MSWKRWLVGGAVVALAAAVASGVVSLARQNMELEGLGKRAVASVTGSMRENGGAIPLGPEEMRLDLSDFNGKRAAVYCVPYGTECLPLDYPPGAVVYQPIVASVQLNDGCSGVAVMGYRVLVFNKAQTPVFEYHWSVFEMPKTGR